MTRTQVISRLKKRQGKLTLREFAKSVGVTVAYLSDIYRDRRDPGPAILSFLGLVKRTSTTYEEAQ